MIDKQIEILVLRISPDGKLLEFIMNAPRDYHFTNFYISVVGKDDTIYSIGDSLFTEGDLQDIIEGAISLDSINISKPEIYFIKVEAYPDGDVIGEPIGISAYISDVSRAYGCLVDDILAFDADCGNTTIQDRVIRNYLMLYAHQEALRLGYLDEAKDWFDKINACFSKCGKQDKVGCNCGCDNKRNNNYRPTHLGLSSCGCNH